MFIFLARSVHRVMIKEGGGKMDNFTLNLVFFNAKVFRSNKFMSKCNVNSTRMGWCCQVFSS